MKEVDLINDKKPEVNSIEGFDIRIVPYEEIHCIKEFDFKNLISAIQPKRGDKILDAGAGYGAVTREIIKNTKSNYPKITLLDISIIQLQRAVETLNKLFGEEVVRSLNFVHDSIVNPAVHDCFFDKVVCKMLIHEIKKSLQLDALREIFRILKPNGEIFIWDVMLNNDNQLFFQNVIRKKDELAGYYFLANNRYFLREDEWIDILKLAGFKKVEKVSNVFYEFNTQVRLNHELNSDPILLEKWHEYIRINVEKLSPIVLKDLQFEDHGNNIKFVPPKSIYRARKG